MISNFFRTFILLLFWNNKLLAQEDIHMAPTREQTLSMTPTNSPTSTFSTLSTSQTDTIDDLNRLLRGEISAVETYRQALDKFAREPSAETLRLIKTDHERTVEILKQEVLHLNGAPSLSSGAWGTWAASVQGVAKLIGYAAALKVLKEGEEHGLKEYKEALSDNTIPQSVNSAIRNSFIPKQKQHISNLNEIMSSINQ
jgi:demethoxyubiquinone hydroxylase (CLK1/Coq7/Cat5 family)